MRVTTIAGGVCLLVALAAIPAAAQLRAQVVAQGLSNPVAFVPDPTSTSRFFIVEQGGLIRVLDNGQLLAQPFLDLRAVVRFSGEQGLLGLAFPPDAATSGRFFVNFNDLQSNTVIARFRRSPATALTVSPATRFDLRWPDGQRVIPQPFGNHNGGHLAFGPDGYLYIGLGDGGSGNDPQNRAQDPWVLLGKMLRIDINVPDSHPNGYVVPPDNPFLDAQPVAALGEIWAFGLRNPWRYSFDDVGPGATGALVIGDVGQGAREEVNWEPAGAGGRNYGWSLREGNIPTPGVNPSRPAAFLPFVNPLFDYVHTIGRAVTGGYVYRGSQLPPAYRGRYFVADSVSGVVGSVGVRVNPATGEATFVDAVDHTAELGGSPGSVVSFGRDHFGELYLVTFAGRVLKIVSGDAPGVPAPVTATVNGREVRLQWGPPASGPAPTGYTLEAGSTSGESNLGAFPMGLATTITVSGVADGTYYVRVRAVRNGVAGPPTADATVVVACAVPAAPMGLVRSGTGSTVVLTWTAAQGATSYRIEAGSDRGLTDRGSVQVGGTSFTAPAPNGRHFVRVRGLNACGAGPASNEIQVDVP